MSKRTELREVTIIVCDYCGKDIVDYSSTSKHYTDGSIKNFHSMYVGEGRKTCLQKFEDKEFKEARRNKARLPKRR